MKKFALVLSGGGFKGAFQLGAIKYIKENWGLLNPGNTKMQFNIVTGVSVGSLNGLLVASNDFTSLEKLWNDVALNGVEEIYTSDIIETKPDSGNPEAKLKMKLSWETIKTRFPKTCKNILWRLVFNRTAFMTGFKSDFKNFKSIADNTPLAIKLKTLAKISKIKDCIYKCGFVSLNDGAYHSCKPADFKTDEDFANGILASTTMPIIWNPVEQINVIKNNDQINYTVDGGVRNVSPLGDAISEIKEDPSHEKYLIIIINCSSGNIEIDNFKEKNIAEIALRSLNDIAITEIFNNDLSEFVDKNYIIEQVNKACPNVIINDYDFRNNTEGKPIYHFESIIIQPDGGELGDSLIANDIIIKNRIQHGMKKAEMAIKKHLENPKALKFTIA